MAWVREWTPSLLKIFLRWVWTVQALLIQVVGDFIIGAAPAEVVENILFAVRDRVRAESATTLTSPTWTTVPGVANASVTLKTDSGTSYYRLKKAQ